MHDLLGSLLVSVPFLWCAIVTIAIALGMSVRRYEKKIREEKAATFVGAIGAMVEVLAHTNDVDLVYTAADALAGVRSGLYPNLMNRFLLGAVLGRQRRPAIEEFNVMGEHVRTLVLNENNVSPAAAAILDALYAFEGDAPDLDAAMSAATAEDFLAVQFLAELHLMRAYSQTLPRSGVESLAESAVAVRVGNALKWLWQRWGRIFCFSAGGLALIASTEDGGTRNEVLAGAAFLATGICLQWLAHNRRA